MKSQSGIVKWGLALCLAVGIWGAGPARAGSSDQDERVIGRAFKLYGTGKADKAIAELTQAVEISPANADLYSVRASLLLYQERLPEALHDAQQALKLDPHQTWNHYILARVLEAQGEREQALTVMYSGIK